MLPASAAPAREDELAGARFAVAPDDVCERPWPTPMALQSRAKSQPGRRARSLAGCAASRSSSSVRPRDGTNVRSRAPAVSFHPVGPPSVAPPPLAPRNPRSRVVATACRAVSLRTADAHGLYSQLGFLPEDETVMQRPKPGCPPRRRPTAASPHHVIFLVLPEASKDPPPRNSARSGPTRRCLH